MPCIFTWSFNTNLKSKDTWTILLLRWDSVCVLACPRQPSEEKPSVVITCHFRTWVAFTAGFLKGTVYPHTES